MKEYYWEEFEVQFNAFSLFDKCLIINNYNKNNALL